MLSSNQIPSPSTPIRYSQDIEDAISALIEAFQHIPNLCTDYNPRWLALQLLECEEDILTTIRNKPGGSQVIAVLDEHLARLRQTYGEDADIIVTDQRYRFVHMVAQQVISRPPASSTQTFSDKIDRIVTDQFLGIPLFLAMMWIVFKITTDVSSPFVDWIDSVMNGPVTGWLMRLLSAVHLDTTWLERLLVDGVIAGIGGVLVFVPVLMSLYLALALLEDSGYMARAAFVMDRLMKMLGLHGKSFVPMVVGFGCTVPALSATRTLDNERDRILTGLLVPFMSCSARLPVYILLATIFFPQHAGLVVFGIYMVGIATAFVLGIVLKHTLFKQKQHDPFIIEMTSYRMPTFKNVWSYMWERTASFIRNVWSLIMAASIVIWFLSAIPTQGTGTFARVELHQSAFAATAGALTPIFTPLGFGSWETSGALISGIVAKEMIVSTMAQIYGVQSDETAESEGIPEQSTIPHDLWFIMTSFGEATTDSIKALPMIVGINLFAAEDEAPASNLERAVRQSFEQSSGGHGALAALACMIFVLLYTPCMATIAAERKELGTRWMWFSIVVQFALAWGVAFVVFQGCVVFFSM